MASTDFSLFAYEEEANDQKKEKAPNALRTISEAADMLDVPQHVLRFWETKFSQIKPLKRNGGRRFYRPQDIDVLQQIKHLLYNQGYTIKGAKKAVDDFIHARSTQDVSATEWIAKIPPASVNDNTPVVSAPVKTGTNSIPEMLAEIADALNETEALAAVPAEGNVISPDFDSLRALRAELVSLRDNLLLHLPPATASAQ